MAKFEKGMRLADEQRQVLGRLYGEACETHGTSMDHMAYTSVFEKLHEDFCRETDLDISQQQLYRALLTMRMERDPHLPRPGMAKV